MVRTHSVCLAIPLLIAASSLLGCGDDSTVSSDEEARVAYFGLDRGVDRAIKLGFDGFAAAGSANIPEQSEPGDLYGSMTVGGKVDQGASNNKEMTLDVAMNDYADLLVDDQYEIHYQTSAPVILDLSLKGLPNANMTGTFSGDVDMTGAVEGLLRLTLSISGQTEDDGTGIIRQKAGTVRVTGTAQSENGIYNVDISR
jgi:hypothetical protein